MSDSVWPHRHQPTRLSCPWDSPGKNTGVGCHFLLQCIKVKSESEDAQSSPTLSDPMDCSLPGSSLGISYFLEEISSLFHFIVFLCFFALITEEGFLISPCYSLELCIQMGISFLFSFAFKVKVKSLSCVWLFATPWKVTYQAPQSMGFFRQEYWSGLPFPSPGDLPNPGIEPRSPALQTDALPSDPLGKPFADINLFHSIAPNKNYS